MRLTLRTLLAYMDDLLEPRDTHDLQEKIQNSSLASQLVHRIRTSIGQIRLDSPPLDGEGLGGDPNTVSEYLDNTLDPDRVPEFERVCLDSDEHLGEVAACHQILTLVLGEPAKIPHAMRDRIYAFGQSADSDSDVLSGASGDASQGSIDLPSVAQLQTELEAPPEQAVEKQPEWEATKKASYTRSNKSRWPTLLTTAIIAFALVFAGLRGLGPFDQSHPLAKFLGLQQARMSESTQVPDSGTDFGKEFNESEIEPPIAGDASGNSDAHDGQSRLGGAEEGEIPLDRFDKNPSTETFDDAEPPEFEDRPADTLVLDNPAAGGQQDSEFHGEGIPFADELAADPAPQRQALGIDETDGLQFDSDDFSEGRASDLPADDAPQIATSDPDSAELPDTDDSDSHLAGRAPEFGSPRVAPGAVPPEPMPLRDPIARRNAARATGAAEVIPPFTTRVRERMDDEKAVADDVRAAQIAANEPARDNVQPIDHPLTDDPAVGEQASGVEANDLGRFVSPGHIVAFRAPNSEEWQRLTIETPLASGFEYVSLPVNRPQMTLGTGLQLSLVGWTNLSLDAGTATEAILQLKHGRLIAVPLEESGRHIQLQFGDRSGHLTLADNESVAAIEFQKVHRPGVDPRAQKAHRVLKLYAKSGMFQWAEGDETVEVSAGQQLVVVDDGKSKTMDVKTEPAWISGSDAKHIHATARSGLSDKVRADRPFILSLQEQLVSRRREVRSLAAKSLVVFGFYEPALATLNDPALKAYWSEQVEMLKLTNAQGRESAAAVLATIGKRHADDSGALFRMLWGYDPAQLKTQGSELVANLKHTSLDFRVVSIETLKQITGKGSVYAAEKNMEKTRKSVAHWQRMLDRGQIKYRTPPEILGLLPAT